MTDQKVTVQKVTHFYVKPKMRHFLAIHGTFISALFLSRRQITLISVVVFQIHDLEYPQQIPLRLPSVDNATPTGAIQARDGKALLAKVIATAGDARNSSLVISVKYAILTKMYSIPQNKIEAEHKIYEPSSVNNHGNTTITEVFPPLN